VLESVAREAGTTGAMGFTGPAEFWVLWLQPDTRTRVQQSSENSPMA